jgi:FRG domain
MATKTKPKTKVLIVKSTPEFAQTVQDLLPPTSGKPIEKRMEGNWYRGIGRVSYRLTPSLLRHDPTTTELSAFLKLERVMLEDFRRQSVFHQEGNNAGADADFRLMFMMQHYGVPTRLLDWSTNPFIALYFALTSAPLNAKNTYDEDACVWVLNPVLWNRFSLDDANYGDRGPLTHGDDEAKVFGPKSLVLDSVTQSDINKMKKHPVAILGIANNARMFAQRGVFTIGGRILDPLETQFEEHAFDPSSLTRIVIPADRISEMLTVLVRLGYTDSVTYPDLHGMALEIRRTRGYRV